MIPDSPHSPDPDVPDPRKQPPMDVQFIDIVMYREMFNEIDQCLRRYNLPVYMQITALEYLKACIIRTAQDKSGDFPNG